MDPACSGIIDGDVKRYLQMLAEALDKEQVLWYPRSRGKSLGQSGDDQNEVTGENRDSTVHWIRSLTSNFGFSPETFALSVDLLDRFLYVVKARNKYLQCIGITCFYIAAKLLEEDEIVPATVEFVENSRCGCSVSDVLRMELVILGKLDWDTRAVTSVHFLNIFHALLLSNKAHPLETFPLTAAQHLAYLTTKLELCLSNHHLLGHRPSTLALALISLELEQTGVGWFAATQILQGLAKVNNVSLIDCREKISGHLSSFSWLHGRREIGGRPTDASTIQYRRRSRRDDSSWPATLRRSVEVVSAARSVKRKMVDMCSDDDIYDDIKCLYNDAVIINDDDTGCVVNPTTTCAGEMRGQEAKMKMATVKSSAITLVK